MTKPQLKYLLQGVESFSRSSRCVAHFSGVRKERASVSLTEAMIDFIETGDDRVTAVRSRSALNFSLRSPHFLNTPAFLDHPVHARVDTENLFGDETRRR